ncbi:MAG TPA: glycosyltransferase, partial [Acetobacteraceae bacterium]
CPSRHEPLGNVVIEGWSARRPVVAAAAQGPAELIAPGRDGLLVPKDDANALADALGVVLRDAQAARALAAAGRARFESEFAEAPVLARWRDFLATVEKP